MPTISLTLHLLPTTLAVCRLAADAPLPDWAIGGSFWSITRTSAELSIVCAERAVPVATVAERDWRCFEVAGPLAFTLTGVLAALTEALAEAAISIFALSTYDTDYLLVRAHDLERAIQTLRAAGHQIMP